MPNNKKKQQSDRNFLGGGAYGDVYKKDGKAVKTFDVDSCLIQEYAAGVYLHDRPYIVQVQEMSMQDMTLTMDLYHGSLKDWMWTKTPRGYINLRTDAQRMFAARELLKGLICIHDLDLIHGDVTPKNVLCNWDVRGNITKLVISDLGFVGTEGYARARRTAPAYRELTVVKDFRHDIYSFGVIMLELRGSFKVSTQWPSFQLAQFARAYISDVKVRDITIKCLSEERTLRPTARALLQTLYNESCVFAKKVIPPELHPSLATRITRRDLVVLQNTFNSAKLHHADKAYKSCHAYLSIQGIHSNQHVIYAVATIVIYLSIFHHGAFNVKSIAKSYGVSYKHLRSVIEELLDDCAFVARIFT